MATTSSNSFVNYHWRQILFSITQKNSELTTDSRTTCTTNNGRRGPLPKFWLLTCCVTPKSEFRIDSSMIGQPTDFRHIGHMGADDMSSSYNENAVNSLLRSKGDDEFRIPVPKNFRSKDVPINISN